MKKLYTTFLVLAAFLVGFVATVNAATFDRQTGAVTFAPNGTGADTATIGQSTTVGFRAKQIILAPGSGDKTYTLYDGTDSTGQVIWAGSSKTQVPGVSFNTSGTVVSVLTSSTAVQTVPVDFLLPPSVYLSCTDLSTPTLIIHTQPSSER